MQIEISDQMLSNVDFFLNSKDSSNYNQSIAILNIALTISMCVSQAQIEDPSLQAKFLLNHIITGAKPTKVAIDTSVTAEAGLHSTL